MLLALVVVLALWGGSGIASGESEDPSGFGAQVETAVEGEELPGRRTETSNTFLLPDGTMRTELFESPVNYRDEEGNWQPIEEGLEETPGGAITNGQNSFDLHLPESLDTEAIRVSTGEGWVSERPVGIATGDAEMEGALASYESPASNVSFQFSGLADGLKEDIVLEGPSAPPTLHFSLEASNGLTPTLTEAGAIEFRDAEEKLVAELPAPLMSDSSPSPAISSQVHYGLESTGEGRWQLTVEADREWLEDPARVFPTTIDPTITLSAPSLDCAIANQSLSESSFCGTSGWATVGLKAAYKSSGADEYVRTLLRFDLSSIPKTASISSATLGIYSPSEAKNTAGAQLYDANKNWDKTANWKDYGTDSHGHRLLWTTEGGDFGKYVTTPSTITTAERGKGAGWWEFKDKNLRWLVQRWVDGEVPNEGALLKLSDEKTRECCIERQIEWSSSATAHKPFLSVEYLPPAPSTSKVVSPGEGTTTARRLKLKAAWQAAGVNGVTFQYRAGKTGPFETIPPELVRDASGNALAKWPIPVTEATSTEPVYFDAAHATNTLRVKGGTIQVRAVFSAVEGASANGYSAPVEATVNRRVGGPKDATAEVGPGTLDLLTGNLSVSRTDVTIPGYSTLEFSRSLNTRDPEAGGASSVLGPGWRPGVPVEEAGGAEWRSVKVEEFSETLEGETFSFAYAILTDLEGYEIAFEKEGENWVTPPEMSGFSLTKNNATNQFTLSDPGGNRTVFGEAGTREYVPKEITHTGGSTNSTKMVYEEVEGKWRLKTIIAATSGQECNDSNARTTTGCRALGFTYGVVSGFTRLLSITYYAQGLGGPWEVAHYSYNVNGLLTGEWDPRLGESLKESYTYKEGALAKVTSPGEEPWTLEYAGVDGEFGGVQRLKAVTRPTLLASPTTAQTTIAYEVPLTGSSAPYDMSPTSVGRWAQTDVPQDATAIFPATEVPGTYPPTAYTRATVYYMDSEGQEVNTATPPGAGTSGPSITTSETDEFGNVIRELTAQNRLRALAAGESESAAKSKLFDTHRRYNSDGTQMEEEFGPLHPIRLESGKSTEARFHKVVEYDQGWPGTGIKPHLPTKVFTSASIPGEGDFDTRSTEYKYDWNLRKPTETIVDPGSGEHLNIKTVTGYDPNTGLPIETRQPSNAAGGGAGTTKTIYWAGGKNGECSGVAKYAGLPCKVKPAAQIESSLPKLLETEYKSYNALAQPTEVVEAPPGGSPRTTITTYDSAGRKLTTKATGGGQAIPKEEFLYEGPSGQLTTERLACNSLEESCTGFDNQALNTTYDTLGRITSYEDADGNKATMTYDLMSRPVTTTDGKGSQTTRYDSITGLPVELEDSGAGLFTASYDADGNMTKRTLPDGLTAETTYDATGAPTHLTYTKVSSCGESCNWLEFGLEDSIHGQILKETGTQGTHAYGYDKAGRLVTAQETPTGGSCTTRLYSYDEDSNRTKLTTRSPELGGACASSGGTSQSYTYDTADRLTGSGIVYDSFGRITSLPGAYAGGKTLESSYFSNDMVASQSQGGVTNSFGLDAAGRQRQRLQEGGLMGTEIFHYDGSSDVPAWTERGSTWTREIAGLGGELAAIQESGSEPVLQLCNIHGDIVATAALDPSVTKLKATFSFDEFGNPVSGEASRFGWLGGKQRRTELPSGVIQMGVRSYVPGIGRFISKDPVRGGSANAYDYANADPVNHFDLAGSAGDAPGEIECGEHLEVHHPHKSTHNPKHVNAVLTGQCVGTEVTQVTMKITLTMFRNGHRIWTEPTREIVVTVTLVPSVSPTFKVPFHHAPPCRNGVYRAEASVTTEYPPGYVPHIDSQRISSASRHITC